MPTSTCRLMASSSSRKPQARALTGTSMVTVEAATAPALASTLKYNSKAAAVLNAASPRAAPQAVPLIGASGHSSTPGTSSTNPAAAQLPAASTRLGRCERRVRE